MKWKHAIMACTALVAVAGVYALGRWSALPTPETAPRAAQTRAAGDGAGGADAAPGNT